MRKLALSLSLLLAIENTVSPAPANAAAVNYAPGGVKGGAVEGQVPVNKIGDLLVADAKVIMKGNVVDIEAKDPATGERKTVLSGVVFGAKATGKGISQKLNGYIYFRSGPSLPAIDDPDAEELIDIEEGGIVGGKIVAVNRDRVEVATATGPREVGVEKIRRICSPRIYSFTMPIVAGAPVAAGEGFKGEAKNISLTCTAQPCRPKEVAQAETERGKRPRLCCRGFIAAKVARAQPAETSAGKIVAITAAMLAVAAAIAIPIAIAVPLANRRGNRGPRPEDIALANLLFQRQQPPPPPPPPPSRS